MLVEFAFTPEVFDETQNANLEEWSEQIRELASSMFPRTAACPVVVSDLYGGGWYPEAEQAVKAIKNQNDRFRCESLLKKIERCLVTRPSGAVWPSDEDGWGRAAIGAHMQAPIDRMVLTDACRDRLLVECSDVKALSEVSKGDFWQGIPRDSSPRLDIRYQIALLRTIALHSDFVWLASPHIRGTSDDETNFAIELIKAAFLRPRGFPVPAIEIHVEGPDNPRLPDFPKRLQTSNSNIRSGLRDALQPQQSVDVVVWPKLLDRILLGGTFTEVSSGGRAATPRWGVSMSHLARRADRGSTQVTEWKLLDAPAIGRWYREFRPENRGSVLDSFSVAK